MFSCTLLAVFADLDPFLPRSGAHDNSGWEISMYCCISEGPQQGFCQPPIPSNIGVQRRRLIQGVEVVGLVVFSGLAQMLGRATTSGDGNEMSDVEGMPEVAHPKSMGSEWNYWSLNVEQKDDTQGPWWGLMKMSRCTREVTLRV